MEPQNMTIQGFREILLKADMSEEERAATLLSGMQEARRIITESDLEQPTRASMIAAAHERPMEALEVAECLSLKPEGSGEELGEWEQNFARCTNALLGTSAAEPSTDGDDDKEDANPGEGSETDSDGGSETTETVGAGAGESAES